MKKYHPTLRLTIGVALSGLILITSVLLSVISYISSRNSLIQLSEGLINQNARVVKEQVHGYLSPVRTASEHTRALLKRGVISKDDRKGMEEYFYDYLKVNPTISMFFYGDVKGNFLMVKRQPSGAIDTKIVKTKGKRSVIWRHRDPGADINSIKNEIKYPNDRYDPRVRTWFKGAMKVKDTFWSNVYVFFTDRMPGVTVAVPYKDKNGKWEGAFTVNIGLVDLSDFLAQHIKVGSSGQALLIDELGQIIATHDKKSLIIEESSGKRRMRKLHESKQPEVLALSENEEVKTYLKKAFSQSGVPPLTLRYKTGGNTWVCTLLAIDVGKSKRWVSAVIAKEDDFLASAKKASRKALLIAVILALLALVAGLFLSRIISNGLSTLVAESERVKRMELDSTPSKSSFREINEVLASFESMKVGLRAFQKYVPMKVVRKLLDKREDPELGGSVKQLTILFSDIKGFTSISERLEPMELAHQLGEYLSIMTRRIQKRQGTVDKYIGDAVMAFWGAPSELPEHATEACHAILEAVDDLGKHEKKHPYLSDYYTRIGIHTASVVVGNFGCEDRLNYTIIGDGVNLASRLEGLNKVFGTQIIVSEDTAQVVSKLFLLRRLAKVAVVGRTAPCVVYELICTAEKASLEQVKYFGLYEEALDNYFARDFSTAIKIIESLETLDAPSTWLLTRCSDLIDKSLPKEWDGVITMDGK
jgi:adenylate cyclase